MATILVVDDDTALVGTVAESLVAAGFCVVQALTTTDALSRLDAGLKADLCLVDLVMPHGSPDGLAFARTVKDRYPALSVILMTGYYGFVTRSGTLPAKVLYKPVEVDVLVAEIRNELGR